MNRLAWGICVAVLASAGAAGGGEAIHLAGAGDVTWVIVSGAEDYQVYCKVPEASWKPVRGRRVGRVAAITGVGDAAAVFFADGTHVRYFPRQGQGRRGVRAPKALWPARARLLGVGAVEQDKSDAILVLIRRPAVAPQATRPTTATTTAPATTPAPTSIKATTSASAPAGAPATTGRARRSELALLRYAAGQWSLAAILPDELPVDASKALLAARGQNVYVLLTGPKPVLAALADQQWRPIDLPDALAGATPLTLMAVPGGVVLAGFNAPAPGQVGLSVYGSGQWSKVQAISENESPFTWPAAAPPAAGTLDARIALAWQEQSRWFFATCSLDGRMLRSRLTALDPPVSTERAGRAQALFFWIVLGLIIVLMFWPGQTIRTAPFSLPPTIIPARLGRRVVAFAIDILPFMFASVAFIGDVKVDDPWKMIREGPIPDRLIYASMAFLTAYPLYCILMEARTGATLGKMAMRLRVVGDQGRPPTLREVALRNISKVPELMAFVLLLVPLLRRYRQRLGDWIAWTAVIDAELSVPPKVLPPQDDDRNASDDDDPKL